MTDTATYEAEQGNAEVWATIFGPGGHPDLAKQHWLHRKLPTDPRCRLCLAPFNGLGGWWMRRKGKAPSSRNPHYCSACDGFLEAFPGGAEVEMTVLFADVRQSVQTAQGMAPADVSARINRFLDRTTRQITDHDGFIMAFYGDCVVAVFPPGFSGPDHAKKALDTARALCRDQAADGVPFGVGVHTGPVFIGTVQAAKGLFRDVSVFGHAVNVCARLSDIAPAGGALLSAEALAAAGETAATQPRVLKGIDAPVSASQIGGQAA